MFTLSVKDPGACSGGQSLSPAVGLNEADPIRPIAEFEEVVDKALSAAGITAEDLSTMDAFELETRLQDGAKKVLPGELFIFQPVIDGKLLTKTPGELIKDGAIADADVICGTVTGDSWMFCRKVREQIHFTPERLRGFATSPSLSWAISNVKTGQKPIYTYLFERSIPSLKPGVPVLPGPPRDPANKTPHSSEIAYVFGTFIDQPRNWTDYDAELSDAVMTYWTSFAKTGRPGKDWPAYTKQTPLAMDFTDDGWFVKAFPENDAQLEIAEYTIRHPGILENWVDE